MPGGCRSLGLFSEKKKQFFLNMIIGSAISFLYSVVLGEEETVLFEQAVGSLDIDNVPEMEKGEVLVSSVGDGSFQR